MGILDTVASAAAGPLGPLIQMGGKILDKVIPAPQAAEAAKFQLAQLAQRIQKQNIATEQLRR